MSVTPSSASAHRVARVHARKGAVAAQVTVCLTVIFGFTALTIDVGYMYNVRAELQRSADAAALGAAAALSDWSQSDPRIPALDAAQKFANLNHVLGEGVTLDPDTDVTYGSARMLASGKYEVDWEENDIYRINAVRVRVRRTSDSPSGPVPLFFANVLGVSSAEVAAEASAVLIPRDIAFVLDLSASHNDDSSLRSIRNPEIEEVPIHDVWKHLFDTSSLQSTDGLGYHSLVDISDNGDGTASIRIELTSVSARKALSHVTFGLPPSAESMVMASAQTDGAYEDPEWGTDPTTGVLGIKFNSIGDGLGEDGEVATHTFSFDIRNADLDDMIVATKAGRDVDADTSYNLRQEVTLGNMNSWGDKTIDYDWAPAGDPGLVKLQKNKTWSLSSGWTSQTAVSRGFQAYTAQEMTIINRPAPSGSSEYTSDYRRRVRVALGIDLWTGDANHDGRINGGEVVNMIPYPDGETNPDSSSRQVGGSWDSFIDYVRSSGSSMSRYDPANQLYGSPELQYSYGLKTWVDFLQDMVHDHKSPGMEGAPAQPMGAVADATKELLGILQSLDTQDQVALVSYADVAYGPDDRPHHMSELTPDLSGIALRVGRLYPGMWTVYTNIADGIEEGREVLFESEHARDGAAKVMILLTDGIANRKRPGSILSYSEDAKEAAREAVENRDPQFVRPVQIHTISVGGNADTELMQEIAEIGHGEHYHAAGSIDEYKEELREIFHELGGKRPAVLIE